MQVETLPVETLRPYLRNARTHSRKQVRQIADSILKFGFCNPVLVDDEGQIIAGHGRVAAAKLLGMRGVPAVRLSHLSGPISGLTSSPTTSSLRRQGGTGKSWPSSCRRWSTSVSMFS
jgi:hypothetical protein